MSQESTRQDDTQSLTASVMDYPMEHGRRYHRYHEGAYLYPNDEQELDRMDLQHHMLKIINSGQLFFAPVENPRRILDIGTGSGIWPIELATQFPTAEIIGTDLSPVQPNEVPENVHFIVDDATEDDWLWGPDHFDLVHVGHLSGALSSYKDLLRLSFKHLTPGGYVESHEFDPIPKCDDGTMPPMDDEKFSDYALQDLMDLHVRSGQVSDPPRQFRVAHRLVRWMRDVGFVDVQERVVKVPVNPWPGDSHLKMIGSWSETNIMEAVAGWSYKPLSILGWSKPEIEVFLVDVRKSVQNREVHAYLNYHVAPMSFGRHACRHVLQPSVPSSHGITDHVWISDDFLISTFRRFAANGQRRYESRVPGPLEARRRLARRKNTSLSVIAGAGPLDDIACLFGRNGKEHLKWADGGSSGKGERDCAYLGFLRFGAPPPPPAPPMSTPVAREEPSSMLSAVSEKDSRGRRFKERLLRCDTVESAKSLVKELEINMAREPGYSQLIFDHFLSTTVGGSEGVGELALFLDDPQLNVRGARNYLTVIELIVSDCMRWSVLFDAVPRALELGLIPPDELEAMLKKISGWVPSKKDSRIPPPLRVTEIDQRMWDAIGRCDIYGHWHLNEDIVETWLGAIRDRGMYENLPLAKSIIVGARGLASPRGARRSSWASLFIIDWLGCPERLRVEVGEDYANEMLSELKPGVATATIISITESLAFEKNNQALKRWQKCLTKAENIEDLASSKRWTRGHFDSHIAPSNHAFAPHQQVIIRLWALRSLAKSFPSGGPWIKHKRPTDRPIMRCFRVYERERMYDQGYDFFNSFRNDLLDLKLPFNGLLVLAADMMTKKALVKSTRHNLTVMESSDVSFEEIFGSDAFQDIKTRFYSQFEKISRNIDVTSPSFIEKAINIARSGNSRDIWTLFRVLDCHTPLKLVISTAWEYIPEDPEDLLVRHGAKTGSSSMDPHVALAMIHLLADSVACAERLNPRRSFGFIHWLYVFLVKHGAPVKPSLVRAMYHAGVVRYRRRELMKEIGGPDVFADLMETTISQRQQQWLE
ncbi:hypothetical protein BO70DRAFT_389714 [Aspergillus heteromorphus CBS 117.55]|uniref:TAM domain methyltransferase n=1 Tax=Aspergillus heteromorphus CBS 117.55 TaxID=1448321 RepID=A0A317VGK0_9EURO|nr:uncharacterized protein BO70DRAFT_389714 [Aspergillus heteromorphus CBS 117.55]PWY70970.1 hypothetical protein BO70DRAFT_389714 [Aspergillus heteromorphus CBS 117.55]